MSLLTEASLVITPNAVEEGKLFSIIPTDGSGDLTVTRATTATRVNSAGLIEVVPRNLVRYSEQFDNATWTKYQSTITTNVINSPIGTLTADKIIPSAVSDLHYLRVASAPINLISGVSIATYSIYAKQGEYYNFRLGTSATAGIGATFNLSNGTISNNTAISAFIEDVGNGWYRCIVRGLVGSVLDCLILNNSGVDSFAGNAVNGLYFWGAQIEGVSTATEYFPTTDRLDVPRLDYTNSSCPSILVEPQRTNLLLRSNELSTAPNVLDNVTGTSNFYVSPDGSINAIKLAETVVNDRHGFYQYFNVTAQTYTISVFTKQIGRRYISLMSDFTGTNSLSFFDLQEKVVVSNGTGFTCSIEEYSDGWFRLSATVTASAGLKYIIFGGSTNGTTNTYIGNTSTFMTFYGFQLEAGSNATSYIPTIASAVTRNADNISKTGIADLIGQTEGVLYANVKFNSLGTGDSWLTISSGTNANWIFIGKASNKIRAYVKGNNSVVFDNSVTNITSNQLMKIAIAYKSGNIALYINGSLIATSTNSFTFSSDLSLFALDSSSGISENISETTIYQEIILFKNRLTNTELAQLTTL